MPTSRRLLAIGAASTAVGLAIAAASPGAGASERPVVGGLVFVIGWVTLAWGVHSFGRDA
jgi:hypothetical protein